MRSPLPALQAGLRSRFSVLAVLMLALVSGLARAQPEPPAAAPAPTPAPARVVEEPTPPPAPTTAPAATPSIETTAPTEGTTTTAPMPIPTLTPEPTQAPPSLALDPGRPPTRPSSPFYQRDWFWGAVGLVILTTAVILVSVASSGTDTPTTTLGSMRAF
jgi:hypothetical protein